MPKSLFDDVPEPLFDEDDPEEQESPVTTEEQPDIPVIINDDDLEDIGQRAPFTATWSTPVYDFHAGPDPSDFTDHIGRATATITFNYPVLKSSFTTGIFTNTPNGLIVTSVTGSGSATSATTFTIVAGAQNGTNHALARFRFRLSNLIYLDGEITRRPGGIFTNSPTFNITARIEATWSSVSYNAALGSTGRFTTSFTFNRSVSGIVAGDFRVQVQNQRHPTLRWEDDLNWIIRVSGSGSSYTVTADPPVGLNSRARIVHLGSRGLIPGDQEISSDFAVNTSLDASWGTPSFCETSGTHGRATAIITFGLAVTGVSASDFEIQTSRGVVGSTGWTIAVTGTGTTRTVTADAPEGTNGRFIFRLKANSVLFPGNQAGPQNNTDSASFAADNSVGATFGTPSYCGGSNRATASITFTETVTNFTGSDIQVILNSNNSVQSGWSHSVTGSGTSYVITSTPPTSINGIFKLRLRANSVTHGNVNGPTAAVDSPLFNVDNRITGGDEVAAITFGGGSFCPTSRRITWTAFITGTDDENELSALNAADVTLNNVVSSGAAFTPTETVTRTAAGASSYRIQTTQIPVGRVGDMSVSIRANALGADTNAGVTSGCVNYDTRADALVGRWIYANWCETSGHIKAAIQFDQAITGLNVNPTASLNGDLHVTNDTQTANFTRWTFSFSGHTGSGTTAALAANTSLVIEATPPANTNTNVYLHFVANSVTYSGTLTGPPDQLYTEVIPVDNTADTEPPGIAIDSGMYDATARRVTWTAFVTGASTAELNAFTAADVTVNNTVSDGTAFTPTVTVTRTATGAASFRIQTTQFPTGRVGDISITIRVNALGSNTNQSVTSGCVNYDTRAAATPTVATATWNTPSAQTGTQATLQGRLTFGGTTIPVTGIEPGDFDVIVNTPLGNVVHPEASWTIQVSHSNVTTGRRYVDVTAIPNGTFVASFGLRLREDSVRSDGSAMDNAPENNVDSTTVAFNNRDTREDIVPQVIIGTGAFCPTSRKITWPISVVNADATEFAALTEDDISITDSNMAMPALAETIVSRGTNSLIVEILVPTERNGTASITVAANALGANTNTAVTSNDVPYDTRTTQVLTTITYGTPVPDNAGRDIEFPVTFSDIGEGLTGDDFTVTADNGTWNVTIRDGTGGANTKVIVVNNTEPYARMGNLTITIAADAFTNRTVSDPRTSPSAAYNFTSTITATTITFGSPQVSNLRRTIYYPVDFSNIGAGLEPDDISVSATNGTWEVEIQHAGNNRVYIYLYNNESVARSGSLTITIAEDAFFNRTLPSSSSDRTSGTATYNFLAPGTRPFVTFSTDRTGNIAHGETFTVFASWNRAVTGFTANDLILSTDIGSFVVRFNEDSFTGSGAGYKFNLMAPPEESNIRTISIRVDENAVDGGNFPAYYEIELGVGTITPTILTANEIEGDGLAYTHDAIYTIGQNEADVVGRLRSYNESGVLQTNNLVTFTDDLDLGQERHARSIDILDNRFLISARYFGRFGITRATDYVDSRSFNKLFIDSGDFVNSFEVTHIIQDPLIQVGRDFRGTQPRIPARATRRLNEFTSTQIVSERVATDSAVEAIAVGTNRIYLLVSGGSFENPQYDIQIYDLSGELVRTLNVDVSVENTREFGAIPAALAATPRFLYLGFESFRDPLRGRTTGAPWLNAYTLEGDRLQGEDIHLTFPENGGNSYYGVRSMDFDESAGRMWMIVRRASYADAMTNQWFGHFDLSYPIDAGWSAIRPQTLRAGDTFDLKPYGSEMSRILFAPQESTPSWVSLNNGVITVATSGLPTTNTTARLAFLGIGSGRPAYVSFELTLLREAPTWRTI